MNDEKKVGTLRAASGNKFLVVYGRPYKRETRMAIILCALRVQNKNVLIFYLTQRTQRDRANSAAAGAVAGYARQENAEEQCERKTEDYPPPPSLRSSSHLSQGDKVNGKRKGENGKLSNAITHFLPLRQGESPAGGEGVDRDSLRSLRSPHAKQNVLIIYLTQRPQRTQNSKAKCAVAGVVAGYARQENAEEQCERKTEDYPPPPLRSSTLSQGDS